MTTHHNFSRVAMLEALPLRRGERTDIIYRDHIYRRRSRNPLHLLRSWLRYQFTGENRRSVDRTKTPPTAGPLSDGGIHDHAW